MFNLLIIDDEASREHALTKIFESSNFRLDFIFTKHEFFAQDGNFEQYDCVLCDINFDHWTDPGTLENMTMTVLKSIGKNIPIVIYSSYIPGLIEFTNRLIDDGYNLVYTIGLNKPDKDSDPDCEVRSIESNTIICNNLSTILLKTKKFSYIKKGEDDDINILHLSDLQFGDPAFNVELSNNFESVIRREISKKEIPSVDFIIITGDISYSGKPTQFEEAYKWIHNLAKALLGDCFYDRVLIVPGNHDANLSMCSLNRYEYQFPKMHKEEGNIKLREIENTEEYSNYSIDPFRDFAFRLTKDSNWLESDSLCFFNYKFCYLGFKFLQINTVVPNKQLGKKDAVFEFSNNEINELREINRRSINCKSLPTIILTHPSPKHLGYDTEEDFRMNWTSIASFFKEINAALYVFGHRHKNLIKTEIPLDSESNISLCGTATLLCKPDEGDRRGLKIIQIKRNKKSIVKIDIAAYSYTNNAELKRDS